MSMKLKLSESESKKLDRELFKSGILSMLYSLFTSRKEQASSKGQKYLLQDMATAIGVDKSQASRWFNGDVNPNWRLSTFYDICDALGGELRVEILDRQTGEVHTPAGVVERYLNSDSLPTTITMPATTSETFVVVGGVSSIITAPPNSLGIFMSANLGMPAPPINLDNYGSPLMETA